MIESPQKQTLGSSLVCFRGILLPRNPHARTHYNKRNSPCRAGTCPRRPRSGRRYGETDLYAVSSSCTRRGHVPALQGASWQGGQPQMCQGTRPLTHKCAKEPVPLTRPFDTQMLKFCLRFSVLRRMYEKTPVVKSACARRILWKPIDNRRNAGYNDSEKQSERRNV